MLKKQMRNPRRKETLHKRTKQKLQVGLRNTVIKMKNMLDI
jgi:hypothetical protein